MSNFRGVVFAVCSKHGFDGALIEITQAAWPMVKGVALLAGSRNSGATLDVATRSHYNREEGDDPDVVIHWGNGWPDAWELEPVHQLELNPEQWTLKVQYWEDDELKEELLVLEEHPLTPEQILARGWL
jgi:hypothetical protein